MSVEIKKVNDRHYTVNGKTAQLDMNENWIAIQEFTPAESAAFFEHIHKPIILLRTDGVLAEVKQEREKQEVKWGEQNHTPIEWIPILGEEVGEVNKAVLETYFGYEGVNPKDYREYRKELIQVAAVAVSMVECLDRQRYITK